MNTFLQLPAERRRLAFQQVDESMGLQAFSVEKDFWVCWTLRELFTLSGIGEHLTFKGGTSLSKAWKLIRRFSEDIDLKKPSAPPPSRESSAWPGITTISVACSEPE